MVTPLAYLLSEPYLALPLLSIASEREGVPIAQIGRPRLSCQLVYGWVRGPGSRLERGWKRKAKISYGCQALAGGRGMDDNASHKKGEA